MSAELSALQRALQEREALLGALLDHVVEHAAFSVDRAGRITEWNRSGDRLFGRDAPAALATPLATLLLLSGPLACEDLLAAARLDGCAHFEGWCRRGEADRFWGAGVITALSTGPEGRFGVIVQDLSARR